MDAMSSALLRLCFNNCVYFLQHAVISFVSLIIAVLQHLFFLFEF